MTNLTITGYSDEKFSSLAPSPNKYVAMLNPENLDMGCAIDYSQEKSGSSSSAPKFTQIPSETLNFELVIDCTGVVDNTRTNLKDELTLLSDVAYGYKSETHRPNFVIVSWGNTLSFKGVLTGMSISYTFFKPDGTALRARVKLNFKSYIDADTQSKEQNQKSPDVTHHILVREGDSLPFIANTIYRNPSYFVALAKANHLNKFRHLVAGSTVLTPPLKSSRDTHDE